MAQIITTKGSLVLNTTSVYQITPGLGKRVSTPSMVVFINSM